jgi:hypothetical protein
MPVVGRARKQRSARVSVIEFVRPERPWPAPYSLEQAFEVLRVMVATGRRYTVLGPWGRTGVSELLQGGHLANCGTTRSIASLRDLTACFHRALLAKGNIAVERWRREQDFTLGARRLLSIPHYRPDGLFRFQGALFPTRSIDQTLTSYFDGLPGTDLRASLNSVHWSVRRVHRAVVDVDPDGFRFWLEYGASGSVWSHTLARTRRGESFLDTFDRAWTRCLLLTGAIGRGLGDIVTRLNQEDADPSNGPDASDPSHICWVAFRRPIHARAVTRIGHFALVPLGPGPSLTLVHWPSGRILRTQRTGTWDRLDRLAHALEAAGCGKGGPPRRETIQATARHTSRPHTRGRAHADTRC